MENDYPKGVVANWGTEHCDRCGKLAGDRMIPAKHELDTEYRLFCPDCLDIIGREEWYGNYTVITLDEYFGWED